MRKLRTVLAPLPRAAASLVIGIAIATTALVGLSPSAASADSGFCGVRVSDQGYPGGWLYTARNKCSFSIYVTIVVGGHRQWCETLAPYGGQYTWWNVTYDPNWYIVNC